MDDFVEEYVRDIFFEYLEVWVYIFFVELFILGC